MRPYDSIAVCDWARFDWNPSRRSKNGSGCAALPGQLSSDGDKPGAAIVARRWRYLYMRRDWDGNGFGVSLDRFLWRFLRQERGMNMGLDKIQCQSRVLCKSGDEIEPGV